MKEINLLDALYNSLSGEFVQDNPFETWKQSEMRKDFSEKYIKSAAHGVGDMNDAELALFGLIDDERENAFKVGFRTAAALLSGSGTLAV